MASIPEIFDSGVPRKESDILAGYYLRSQARLRGLVTTALSAPRQTEAKRARAAALLAEVDRAIGDLKLAATTWTGRHIPAAYREGMAQADRQLAEIGFPRSTGVSPVPSFSQIDTSALRLIARDTAADLNGAVAGKGAVDHGRCARVGV